MGLRRMISGVLMTSLCLLSVCEAARIFMYLSVASRSLAYMQYPVKGIMPRDEYFFESL